VKKNVIWEIEHKKGRQAARFESRLLPIPVHPRPVQLDDFLFLTWSHNFFRKHIHHFVVGLIYMSCTDLVIEGQMLVKTSLQKAFQWLPSSDWVVSHLKFYNNSLHVYVFGLLNLTLSYLKMKVRAYAYSCSCFLLLVSFLQSVSMFRFGALQMRENFNRRPRDWYWAILFENGNVNKVNVVVVVGFPGQLRCHDNWEKSSTHAHRTQKCPWFRS